MIAISNASGADTAEIERLLRHTYLLQFGPHYDADVLAAGIDSMASVPASLVDAGTYFVARLDGKVVGVAGWTDTTPLGDPVAPDLASVRKVAVHPDAAGRGVGAALMAQTHASAREAGKTWMHCLSSLNARRFYAAQGYVEIGRRELRFAGADRGFPVIEMRRDL